MPASTLDVPTSTATSLACSAPAASATKRVLPAPGSPPTNTSCRRPCSTSAHSASRVSSSRSRPTSGRCRDPPNRAGNGGGRHVVIGSHSSGVRSDRRRGPVGQQAVGDLDDHVGRQPGPRRRPPDRFWRGRLVEAVRLAHVFRYERVEPTHALLVVAAVVYDV